MIKFPKPHIDNLTGHTTFYRPSRRSKEYLIDEAYNSFRIKDMRMRFNCSNISGVDPYYRCPRCGSGKVEVRNHDLIWHDGQVHCKICGTYIREYDAG